MEGEKRTGSTRDPGLAVRGVAIARNTVQFHPMIDEPITEFLRDTPLQFFEFLIDKFDDLAGFNVDEMIVVIIGRRLIPRPAVAEIVAFEDSGLLEQPNRPVNGGNRNAAVHGGCPLMQRLDVRMVVGFR